MSAEIRRLLDRLEYQLNDRTEEVVRDGRRRYGRCEYCGNEPHHSTNGACEFRYNANIAADDVRAVVKELRNALTGTTDVRVSGAAHVRTGADGQPRTGADDPAVGQSVVGAEIRRLLEQIDALEVRERERLAEAYLLPYNLKLAAIKSAKLEAYAEVKALLAAPAVPASRVECSCGGVLYGDGNAHTRECPAYEGER